MEKVRGTESKEKSFLKGVVGKRLEELASSQPRVDPLELLGVSSPPAISVPSEPKLPVASSIETPSQEVSLSSSIPPDPHRITVPTEQKALSQSHSSSRKANGEDVALSVHSDSGRGHSDSAQTQPFNAESHTVRLSVSATDSFPSLRVPTHIQQSQDVRPVPAATPPDIPITLLKPPPHWVRFAWALHSCRDQSLPNQTRPVSYAEIGALVDRTEDAVRRSLLQLMNARLIVRKALLQHANGGSVYLFGQAFPALLAPLPTAKKKGPRPRPHGLIHSQNDSQPSSQNKLSSSSSFSFTHSQLLQEWGVENLILSESFTGVEPRSLEPFLRVMPSLEYAQDFFDKVTAVIEQKKTTAKPIADALGFLFACLKKMEVNPPPGWKSRRVRLLEEEARRLEEEAAAIKAARERVEVQRCEVYFLGLSLQTQAELRRKADEAAADNELPVVRDAKRDRRLQELIRDHMRNRRTTYDGVTESDGREGR